MSRFNDILQPIGELLTRKNTDYGSSYYDLRDKYGPVGFYVRLADKMARIEQLDKAGAQVKEESVIDTLSDIIGYATLEIDYRRRKASE